MTRKILLICFSILSTRAESYLPLVTGNTWKLNFQNMTAPLMSLRVVSAEDLTTDIRRGKVEWVTPWGFSYTMIVRSSSSGIYLEGFEFTDGTTASFPEPVPLFPQGTAGQTWNGAMGTVKLNSVTASVTTPAGTYTNVRKYTNAYQDGSTQIWYLAEGVGYVQFGDAPMHFPLSSKVVLPEPVKKQPAELPGPCPLVGVDPSPGPAQTNAGVLESVLQMGGKFYEFSIPWSMLEPSAEKYDFSLVTAAVKQAQQLGMPAAMTIKTVDTNSRSIPSDLASKPWDNSSMLTRFRKMLAALGPSLGTTVKWVHLANEVDLYFINRPGEVNGFKTFFQAGRQQLAASAPGISVALIFGYDALRLSNQTFQQLGSLGDHVGFTFYNLDGISARSPEQVSVELPAMLRLAGTRPIVLTEVGYPSATAANSSPANQRRFYELLFEQLRKSSGKVIAARIYQMTDMSAATAQSIAGAYGQAANSPFAAYLGSLGLVSATGQTKESYRVLQENLPRFSGASYCVSLQ